MFTDRQVISNCTFEHEEGRASGIALCKSLIEALPLPMLDEHATLFILPLALRLVNDISSRCRQLVAEVCCLKSAVRCSLKHVSYAESTFDSSKGVARNFRNIPELCAEVVWNWARPCAEAR
jgi:hypothetical protein